MIAMIIAFLIFIVWVHLSSMASWKVLINEQGNNNNYWILAKNNRGFKLQEAYYNFNSTFNKTMTPKQQDYQWNSSKTQESKVECDRSHPRTDVCEVYGDVRVIGNTSTVVLVTFSNAAASENSTWKIRPYARKWEQPTMSSIKELAVIEKTSESHDEYCHRSGRMSSVPAVVFSTGGFQGNFFHELVDVLLPLFLTSHHYHGEVQFLITDFKPWWVAKYSPILTRLSRYAVVNLDADVNVRCFKKVVVGLRSHKEFGVDPMQTPKGHSMADFTDFLRRSYSLEDENKKKSKGERSSSRGGIKMVIISRKKSRAILNERKVVRMARGLGMKVIVAGAEMTRNLSSFARVVNSCDVMMGVHGAGLSNMVFLPANATVIQIVPWGGLKWNCRSTYGDPAVEMGLRYAEYEIGKDETSLARIYPKTHPVFTDPMSIHKQGFHAVWSTFLDKQNVRIHVGKLQKLLSELLKQY